MDKFRGTGRRPAPLPLNDEDMAEAFGEGGAFLDDGGARQSAVSYVRLFFTIILSAPVAAFLALLVMDMYTPFSENIGLKKNEPPAIVNTSTVGADEEKRLAQWVDLFEKNNRALVQSINKQTKAIIKLANKKPGSINVSAPKAPVIKIPAPEIVVVKVPTRETFSLAYEKQKVLRIAHVDMDDPVTQGSFDKVRSRQLLKEVISSLDNIIRAAKTHREISGFLKKNAIKAKTYATKRLSKI